MIIKILAEGGSMKPGPALSQKLGPAGININQVIQKVNEATENFSGLKVPVELEINPSTKEFQVIVFSPPTSELLKKELGLEKGSGNAPRDMVGTLTKAQIEKIAKEKLADLNTEDLENAKKIVAGTARSMGIKVEE